MRRIRGCLFGRKSGGRGIYQAVIGLWGIRCVGSCWGAILGRAEFVQERSPGSAIRFDAILPGGPAVENSTRPGLDMTAHVAPDRAVVGAEGAIRVRTLPL